MIPKPSGCIGCPFYSKGKYFTPDIIRPHSKVLFIAQNPGPDEEAGRLLKNRRYIGWREYVNEYEQVQPQPLIGATGSLFNARFLPLSGLQRSDVSLANAIRCRPGTALGLRADALPMLNSKMRLEYSDADIVKALKHCRDTYLSVPQSTELIVTMGRYAMFQLTGIQNEESEYGKKQGVMESWRGYGVNTDIHRGNSNTNQPHITIDTSRYHHISVGQDKQQTVVFFTMHLAALYHGQNKRFFHATLQDFYKIKLLLAGKWPKPLPTWHSNAPDIWPSYSAFDTEYYPETNELIRWSLCDAQDMALYCVESGNNPYGLIPMQKGSTVVIQNALADISHLSSITDISRVNIEDMMLAHSVLWTGEPHSLNYIASKYGAFNRYKHLSSDHPQLYSALDAYEPMYMWQHHFLPEFRKDQQSWYIYKKFRLPLINIINKAQQTGARLDSSRLIEVQAILKERLEGYKQKAREITGDDKFNLGGRKKIMEEIYG